MRILRIGKPDSLVPAEAAAARRRSEVLSRLERVLSFVFMLIALLSFEQKALAQGTKASGRNKRLMNGVFLLTSRGLAFKAVITSAMDTRNHLLKAGSMRNYTPTLSARVAELADALDSGSSE